MALTFTRSTKRPLVVGDKRWSVGTLTFDSSYPTGGEAVTSKLFHLSKLDTVIVNQPTGIYVMWEPSTQKILVKTALITEASDTSDQSAVSVQVCAIGD